LIKEGLPEDYLLLLGGPFAAAIASKAIVSGKVQSGALTKPTRKQGSAGKPNGRIGEAFSDDQGNADLVDTQYLLFNFLALVFVIGGFVADPSGGVPTIPALLVGLTGVSAAAYVSKKAVVGDVPSVTSVIPARGPEGTPVRVFGQNLLHPLDATKDGDPKKNGDAKKKGYQPVFILFDKQEAEPIGLRKADDRLVDDDADAGHLPVHGSSGGDQIWVKVPGGLDPRTVKVSARNFNGVPSPDDAEFEITKAAAADEEKKDEEKTPKAAPRAGPRRASRGQT
jgi:hypothetical protein